MGKRPGTRATSPPEPPRVHLSKDHDRSVVAALVRSGAWGRIRSGAYVEAPSPECPDTARILALARVAAVSHQLTSRAIVSHTSAALLWGLPTLRTPAATHVIQTFRTRSGASPDVVRHRHALAPDDVVVLHGIPTTSLERTLVDCAMSEPVRGGVVVADAALHRGADRARCENLLHSMPGHRGIARARLVLATADDGAESAGESLARVALLQVGLPRPQTQVPVETCLGIFWADLGWPEARVLAEYDGRGKYAQASAESLIREKRREDALLDLDWRVLRLTKEDLGQRHTLTARVRRVFPTVTLTPRPSLGR